MGVIFDPLLGSLRANTAFEAVSLKTVLMGDSITVRNGTPIAPWTVGGNTGAAVYSCGGYFTWLNARSGHPFTVVKNAAVGGQRTKEMRSRFATDVLSEDAGVVSIMGGTNDLEFSGYNADVTYGEIAAMVEMARNAGRTVLVWAIPPKNGLSSDGLLHRAGANARLRELARRDRHVMFCNSEQGTLDNTNLNGSWKSGFSSDGVHPDKSVATYNFVPEELVDLIKARFAPYPLISAATDTFDGYGEPSTAPFGDGRNLLDSPTFLMSGTGTKSPGSGATFNGDVPSGTIIQGGNADVTLTLSTETRSDGCGKNLIINFTIGSSPASVQWFRQFSSSSLGRFVAGKYYEFSAELNVVSGAGSDGVLGSIHAAIRAAAGGTHYVRDLDPGNASGVFGDNGVYTIVTPRFLCSGTETAIRVEWNFGFAGSGNAQIKIGRMALREYSTPY